MNIRGGSLKILNRSCKVEKDFLHYPGIIINENYNSKVMKPADKLFAESILLLETFITCIKIVINISRIGIKPTHDELGC